MIDLNITDENRFDRPFMVRFYCWFWIVTTILGIGYFLLFGVSLQDSFVSKMIYLPFQLLIAYIIIAHLLPKILFKGKYLLFFTMMTILSFTASWTMYMIQDWYIMPLLKEDHIKPSLGYILSDWEGTVTYYMRVLLILPLALSCFEFAFHIYRQLLKKQRLIVQKKESELNMLKSQIHPSFLVHSMRQLESFSQHKDPIAIKYVELLSEILDFLVYKGGQKLITLEDEIQMITKYVTLREIEVNKALQINWNHELQTSTLNIKPLVVFSLFTYFFQAVLESGINQHREILLVKQVDNIIQVSATLIGDDATELNYPADEMKKQLDIAYPHNSELKINKITGEFNINLSINLNKYDKVSHS